MTVAVLFQTVMSKDRVTPFRLPHRVKEARLDQMRERFAEAHPLERGGRRSAGSARAVSIVLGLALLMILFASWVAS